MTDSLHPFTLKTFMLTDTNKTLNEERCLRRCATPHPCISIPLPLRWKPGIALFPSIFRFFLSSSPEISPTPIQSSCSSHHIPNVGLMPGPLVSVLHGTYPGQTPNFTRHSLSSFFYPVINYGNRRGTTTSGAPTVSNCSAACHDVKARPTCDRVIIHYTDDEYRDMLLTISGRNVIHFTRI